MKQQNNVIQFPHEPGGECAPTHITICFLPSGVDNLYPNTSDPELLAERFTKLVHFLHENPEAILCAAGMCGGEE